MPKPSACSLLILKTTIILLLCLKYLNGSRLTMRFTSELLRLSESSEHTINTICFQDPAAITLSGLLLIMVMINPAVQGHWIIRTRVLATARYTVRSFYWNVSSTWVHRLYARTDCCLESRHGTPVATLCLTHAPSQ